MVHCVLYLSGNRAAACSERLAELNPYVPVKTLTTPLDETTDLNFLNEYQVLHALCNPFVPQTTKINNKKQKKRNNLNWITTQLS